MKNIIAFALAVFLSIGLLAGCGSNNTPGKLLEPKSAPSKQDQSVSIITPSESVTPSQTQSKENLSIQEILQNLKQNEYEGLEITAELDPKIELIPGGVTKVEVLVKNTGNKTIVYDHGPEIFTTPMALLISVEGLQPILPKDHLGVKDEKNNVRELKAGEEKRMELHVMAIEPDAKFEEKVHQIFDTESKFIIDIEWDILHERFPELQKADAGEYKGSFYFTYSILEGTENAESAHTPTGYAMSEFVIIVK